MKKIYLLGMVFLTASTLLIPLVSSTILKEEIIENEFKTIEDTSVIRIIGSFSNSDVDIIVERITLFQIGWLNPTGIYRNIHIIGRSGCITFCEPYPIRDPVFTETFYNQTIELNIDFFIGIFNRPVEETVGLNGWAIGTEVIQR